MKKFFLSTGITKWQTWVLALLIFLVIFLRTYHFHDWLLFGDDQARDAYVTNDVITGKSALPLAGPFMSYSGNSNHSEEDSFHLGPIYYYFQIISAKIFGSSPDKLAYPDLFFAILSIPLFYLFSRISFSKNISLGLTGLYAVSAYFIEYSRFAWNTNLIPFFVLLLLVSLYKFLEKNEKTGWIWVLSLGVLFWPAFQYP
jgi:4-amino-4-deoxy-L-arabinose transferase-like glycosyltransferase